MTVPRRVRTQAERDTDGTAWRAVADSRPGYATWPQTAPGSPSWWLRFGEPEIHHHAPARPPHLGPPPVAGETCARWCGFCHLNAGEPEPAPVADAAAAVGRVLSEHLPAIGEALTNLPPRRRWWHRLTRRG